MRTIRSTKPKGKTLQMEEEESRQVKQDLEPEASHKEAAKNEQDMEQKDMELVATKKEATKLSLGNIYAENLGGSIPKVELVDS